MSGTPKAGSLVIYKLDTDGLTHSIEQVVGTPATTPNAYSVATSVNLTFNTTTTFTDNTASIVAYYLIDSASTSQTLKVLVTDYPTNYTITGDTMVRGQDGNDKFVQFTLPNVKPQLQMDLGFNVDKICPFIQ